MSKNAKLSAPCFESNQYRRKCCCSRVRADKSSARKPGFTNIRPSTVRFSRPSFLRHSFEA
eukprot:241585-Lingulodinium_polyedra.AAC.1